MKKSEYPEVDKVVGREVTAKEIQDLYLELPNHWFLLEVLKMDQNGRAVLLKIAGHDPSKDALRDHLLELSADDKKYIFFFADPEKACEI